MTDKTAIIQELAPTGTLRVAVNTSNGVLVQLAEDGTIMGIVSVLGPELARSLDLPVQLIPYKRPSDVFEDVANNAWDVCFLAIEPERAAEISFTKPYVEIDGTFLVLENSPHHHATEMDRPGIRIGVGKGSAYELFLSRTYKQASLDKTASASSSGETLQRGELDAIAGVRQALDKMAAKFGGMRVMEDRFMAIGQAAGVPKGRPVAHAYLESFIAAAKASGLTKRALAESGQDPRCAAP